MDWCLDVYDRIDLDNVTGFREGETKIGEQLKVLEDFEGVDEDEKLVDNLEQCQREKEIKFCLLFIPEDIGARASKSRIGSDRNPKAFLKYFCNLQANRFLDCHNVLVLGELDVVDIMEKAERAQSKELHELCFELDQLVEPVLSAIFNSGLIPIVIGGGNNNILPILRALSKSNNNNNEKRDISCMYVDLTADFNSTREGRNSGNAYTFALHEGLLKHCSVLGLSETFSKKAEIEVLNKNHFPVFTYESCFIRNELSFHEMVEKAIDSMDGNNHEIGLDIDLQVVKSVPTSMRTTSIGLTGEEVAFIGFKVCESFKPRFIHISEGAPHWADHDGERNVGKVMALIVATCLKQYAKKSK